MKKPNFSAADLDKLRSLAEYAVDTLINRNLFKLDFHPVPVLLVGATYPGTWLEHNQDNIFLAEFSPEEAWATQEIFMIKQREDEIKRKAVEEYIASKKRVEEAQRKHKK